MSVEQRVCRQFEREFGDLPSLLVRAPGRVNLIGEHTDYNEGFVLPMAIDQAIWIALRPRTDRQVILHSLDFGQVHTFSLDSLQHSGAGWAEYVKGVAWALMEAGYVLRGWEGVVAGDVPIEAGLSSSAAIEMAAARAFAAVSGLPWKAATMARLGQKAENQWVGVNCGIMDQLISAAGQAGHALLIDCRSLETRAVPVPASARFIVLDSAAPRTLAGSAYNQRRAECESAVSKLRAVYPEIRALRDVTLEMLEAHGELLTPIELQRARHVVSENDRVLQSVKALQEGDLALFGRLMIASHESLRHDYEVSSFELDTLVELAMATPGVLGARLTGAGFGGCAIALAYAEQATAAAKAIIARYQEITHRSGQAYVCTPSQGAQAWSV